MKNIALTILCALIVVSCNKDEINCEIREMKKVKTSYGSVCAQGELDLKEIELISKNVKSKTSEYILSIKSTNKTELKVLTSNKKQLNFNNGHLYLFKKQNSIWVANGEGEWIAD